MGRRGDISRIPHRAIRSPFSILDRGRGMAYITPMNEHRVHMQGRARP